MSDALIHLRVPAELKGRWVRESRSAGMRLGDWLVQQVEAASRPILVQIPADLKFADLRLARDADGGVSFDHAPIARICEASGVDLATFMSAEDSLSMLIVQWYRAHLAAGGERDGIADDLIAEERIESERGGGVSHQPGQA